MTSRDSTTRHPAGRAACSPPRRRPPSAAQRAPASDHADLPADVLALACAPVARLRGAADAAAHHRRPGRVRPPHLRPGRPGHDQRRHRQRHRGRAGVLRPPRAGRSAARRSRRDAPASSAPPAGSGSTPSTTTMSLATITHACDTIEVGDYLEPFVLPAMPAAVRRPRQARARQLRPHPDRHRSPRAASPRATSSSSIAAATTASRRARSSSSTATSSRPRTSCTSSARRWRWTCKRGLVDAARHARRATRCRRRLRGDAEAASA